MKDIRVHISFPDHRKTKRLIKALDESAPLCLVRLWCFAAQHRTDGYLTDLNNMDISEEAGWNGEPEDFIQSLLDIKWLDNTGKGLKLHDWEQHQPFIATHTKRSIQAKKAADTRWEKEKQKQGDVCGEHKSVLQSECDSDAPSPYPSPLPYPLPSQKKKKEKISYENETLNIPLKEREYFIKAFPLKSVDAEIEKMGRWLYANPQKRYKNWKKFINGWLERAEEQPQVQDWSSGISAEIRREQEKLGRSDNPK